MRTVFEAILVALESGEPVVRAAIMDSTGSTPRSTGACMAVFKDGSTAGTIGGGTVEHASQMAAQKMTSGSSAIRRFDLSNTDAANLGMVCGGSMTILLDSMRPSEETITFAKTVLKKLTNGEAGSIETVLAKDKTIQERRITGPNPATETTETVFKEPLPLPRTVLFIGAGHVAQATARIAALTEFQVTVTDDREDFANAERFPDASRIAIAPNFTESMPPHLGPTDHLVIMTRGHKHDRDVLAQALKTKAGYIGMIGSKKKKTAVYDSLLQDGFTQNDLERVHCPIGLAIDAETPEEIAISILGELISFKAGSQPVQGAP